MLQGVAARQPRLANLPTALEALPVRGRAAAVPCVVKSLPAHPGFPNPPELPMWPTAAEGKMDCIAPAYTHTRPVRGPLIANSDLSGEPHVEGDGDGDLLARSAGGGLDAES
jgi:hypothetical protein